MSWWAVIKNRRNVKIPKRRDTKEVPKYAFSRPAIKTKEQIQADQEKLKQKGERQKQINSYVENIEYAEKKSNDNLKILNDKIALYEAKVRLARKDLEKLTRDLGSNSMDERILSLEDEIKQTNEDAEEFIVYHIKYYFIDVVKWFVKTMEKRNKISEAGEQKTEAGRRFGRGLFG